MKFYPPIEPLLTELSLHRIAEEDAPLILGLTGNLGKKKVSMRFIFHLVRTLP